MRTSKHSAFNWVLTVILVFLVMATPALADLVANSVGSAQIIDRSIKAIDISTGAVKTVKIARGAVKNGKIADGAVNSAKISDGAITNADIAAGAGIAASKINRSGLDADTLDGKEGSDFVSKSSPSWSAQTRRYSVPPSAWVKTNQGAASADSITSRDDYAYAANGGRMIAPVYLPDGAEITEVRVFYDDSDAVNNLTVSLFKRTMTAGFPWAFISPWIASSGNSDVLESAAASISPAQVVDNGANVYYVIADDTSASLRVLAVVITYTTDGP